MMMGSAGCKSVIRIFPHWYRSEENNLNSVGSPLVSVIVAAYNVEKYLIQCLDSLVNQTLKNTEIIVINDASTDNSAKIINGYSATYPNFRVIHCESNRGLATVRNIGMRAARGTVYCLHRCR